MSAPREWTLEETNAISRLKLIVEQTREATLATLTERLDADACQVVLDALLTLRHDLAEARRELDLLAAECRASRARDEAINAGPQPHYPWEELNIRRAAVDAAGVLGREER